MEVVTIDHVRIITEEAVITQGKERGTRSCSGSLTVVVPKRGNVVCMCVCVYVCFSSLAQAFDMVQGEVKSDDFLMLS